MRIVVTGASGFIGSNLLPVLVAGGHDVIGVDRLPAVVAAGRHVQLDLVEPSGTVRFTELAAGADAVVHLAARSGVRTVAPHISALRQRDIVEATEVVAAAVPSSTHLIAASSSSVYGGARPVTGGVRASREEDTMEPKGEYATKKAEADLQLQGLMHARRLTIIRPFTVIGELQRPDMALALWTEATRRGSSIEVLGGLDRSRDFTDVQLVVEAIRRITEEGHQGIFNIGSGSNRTLGDLISAIFQVIGRSTNVEIRPAGPEEVPHTLANNDRARSTLGMDFATDLTATVDRMVAARRSLAIA